MAPKLGPVEVLVISFPGSKFNGKIIDDVQSLIDRDIINLIDGVLVSKSSNGDVEFIELEQPDLEPDVAPLRDLMGAGHYDLISEDDVAQLTAGLEPGSSAAMIAFEHEWAKPLRRDIVESGGVLIADLRVPGRVADQVLASLDAG
jgi:Family of unknown function (DUF6325)